MQGDYPLDTQAGNDAAKSYCLGDTSAIFGDDRTRESLDTLLVALDNLDIDLDRVADIEGGQVFLHIFQADFLNGVHLFLHSHNVQTVYAINQDVLQRCGSDAVRHAMRRFSGGFR
jgi:hypothetical protein